jgi:hypothetical protein
MPCNHTRSKLEGHQRCTFDEGTQNGIELERERIIRLAEEWIDDYQGHDSECQCPTKADGLKTFINAIRQTD